MISRHTLDSQHAHPINILGCSHFRYRPKQLLTSGTLKEKVVKRRQQKDTSPLFKSIPKKRMIEIWAESDRFNITIQRLTDQASTILKKGWFSGLQILERCKKVNSEDMN